MPQATIEYSSNIGRAFDARRFGQLLHQRMVTLIDTDLESCKSRLVEIGETLIGDGSPDNAMIHVDLRILSGRTEEQKTALGRAALADVRECLSGSPLNVQLTVHVSDLDAQNYHKLVVTDRRVEAG